MKKHPLIRTLLGLRGNTRACVYAEPLWGIPQSLYTPFVSVYMAALLLTDSQIGLITSVSMLFRAAAALFSGAITDKLGRKRTTFIFDLISWSLPCLLWAFSQNFWWFMIAAAFNGMWQITDISWNCLLVEDADKSILVRIYSLVHLAAHLAVIFAPLAGILVSNLSLIPAVRILYIFSFLSMTAKFVVLYIYCSETEVGKERIKETTGQSLIRIMAGYGTIFRHIFASPDMRLAVVMSAAISVTTMITGTFFSLYATGNLLLPEDYLAYLPILRSGIIVIFLFIILPKLSRFGFGKPLLAGILLFLGSISALLLAPQKNYILLFAYVFLEACSYSLILPHRDSLMAILVDPAERARILSIIIAMTLVCGVPFGYLTGWLSDMDRRLPFLVGAAVYVLLFIVIAVNRKLLARKETCS
jgi:MFS family permease